MGVHGLWKLIEPSGKVVPLDTLEGKVLAVDISIWLHQAIKGYQDSKGSPMPNAHLLTIYNRVCKLLYFRIKPVFVFDGGVPALKKETIAKRSQLKSKNQSEATKIQKQLINTLLKHSAVTKVLSEKTRAELGSQARKIVTSKNDTDDDLFVLPESQTTYESSDSYDESVDDSSGTRTSDSSPTKYFNIHDVDEKSVQFRNLPADVRHEILTDLKETRKQNSWGRIHELPKQSDDFATYQMKRLLKRYSIQACLEEAEKEMGGASLSLKELESLLNDHGVITENKGNRIASDENTRYLYIKDVKKAMESTKVKEMKEKEKNAQQEETSEAVFQNDVETAIQLSTITEGDEEPTVSTNNIEVENVTPDLTPQTKELSQEPNQIKDTEFECDLETAIQLSLQTDKNDAPSSTHSSQDLSHDKEFQSDLKAAITLSLQEVPSTSTSLGIDSSTSNSDVNVITSSRDVKSSDEITSSDTTPISSQDIVNPDLEFSSYLQTLHDSDFDSSGDEVKLDDSLKEGQKAADKIFSAARNYMLEYGGLTQAGIEDIFGKKDDSAKGRSKGKDKGVRFDTGENFCAEAVSSTGGLNTLDIQGGGEVGVMSESDTSSDDDFVEVATEVSKDERMKITTSEKPTELQIEFNTKDELVDDLFSDIFDCEPSISEKMISAPEKESANVANVVPTKSTDTDLVESPQKDFNMPLDSTLLSEDVETQKAIEESIKITNEQSKLPEKLTTSNLMQELYLQKPSSSIDNITIDDLLKLKTTLNQASMGLMAERGTKERLAGNISDQMYQEAQDLLSLFGIPYIVAPMEAEAQCAFLNEIDLTDGTITDDSDIWLFGGKTVYKNFFNHDKQVLEFKSESIQHHFKLSRHQLISLAMLVGSDYTTGIQGIGPVTALEVLAAFPPKSDIEIITALEKFRDWFKTGKKVYGRGKAFLRNKLKNIVLHEGFPSSSVLKAYLEPTVETSRDTFSWGKPRVEALIHYTREKFGWNAKKVTDTLDPVLKRLSDNTSQKRIQDYFKTVYKAPMNTSVEIQQKLSKRVQKALGTISQKVDIEGIASSSDEDMIGAKDAEEMADIEVLKKTKKLSKQKNKAIQKEVETQLKILDKKGLENKSTNDELEVKKPRLANLHRKEVIPQRELAKTSQLQNKMKAIEVFRKSTRGPGFVKKRTKVVKKPKADAELSESDSD